MGEGLGVAKTIAVTGKGGVGKTLVSALTVKVLKKHASGPILALDADPDANLATVLGIAIDKTVGDLREETAKDIKSLPPGMSKSAYIEAGLHEVIVEGEKVDLMTMGRCEGPGCYCYVNNLLREFSDKLQAAYRWIVMDNEAGLEHLSRRTAARIDHLIVVVNESPLSLDCAARIDRITSDFEHGVARKHLLINNVGDEQRIESLRQKTAALDMEFLGSLPHDDGVEACVFEGRSLLELAQSPAVTEMARLMAETVLSSGCEAVL